MPEDTKVQPQAEVEKLEVKAGEETPQPETEPVEMLKPGAEKVPPKETKPRVYSEEEWRKRESEKDQEASELRRMLSQTSLQAQIREAEAQEREAQAQDRVRVEQGLMSEDEAKRSQILRQREQQVYVESLRINADKESISKVKVAEDIAKEYGIDSKELLSDDVKSPVEMIRKAAGLAQKARDEKLEALEAEMKILKSGEPQYDRGQMATTGGFSENMSPQEKIQWALKHQK